MSWNCFCGHNNSIGHDECTKCGSTVIDRLENKVEQLENRLSRYCKIQYKDNNHEWQDLIYIGDEIANGEFETDGINTLRVVILNKDEDEED